MLENMSRRGRLVLTASLLVLGVGALAFGGSWWWNHRPVEMPETADEAFATIGTDRWDRLPAYRQDEYMQQTWRLVEQLPDEQRRELRTQFREDDRLERAMEDQMRRRMIERVRAVNAGEEPEGSMWGSGRPRGQNRHNREDRADRPEPTEEQRQERQQRMQDHIQDRFQSGNPQVNGLIGEHYRERRQQRENRR
jgi:hypothetical protein